MRTEAEVSEAVHLLRLVGPRFDPAAPEAGEVLLVFAALVWVLGGPGTAFPRFLARLKAELALHPPAPTWPPSPPPAGTSP